MNKTLTRRLEQLEARSLPIAEPQVIRVQFIAQDKTVTKTLLVTVDAGTADRRRRRTWK